MCSFGSCQTRFEFLSQFRKVRNAFECFVTQVQTRLPKTKCVWPMKINVICTVYIINGWNHELPKGSEIRFPEWVSISCPTCGTRHESYVTVGEQTLQHMWHKSVKFVNKVCMTTIEFPKSSLKFLWIIPCFSNFETRA